MYRMVNRIVLVFFIASAIAFSTLAKEKEKITLLVENSPAIGQAIKEVMKIPAIADRYDILYYTSGDMKEGKINSEAVRQSAILIVDTMNHRMADYILKNADFEKTKVYGVRSGVEGLEKIIFDPIVNQYYTSVTRHSIKNLILFLLNRDCSLEVSYEEPFPEKGIFHPKAPQIFSAFEDYITWYKKQGLYNDNGFWAGIADYKSNAGIAGEVSETVSELILSLEKEGINTFPVYSSSNPEEFFFDKNRKSRIDVICGLCFKFTTDDKTRENFIKLNVPVFNFIRTRQTIPEYNKSIQGLSAGSIGMDIFTPELNGLIEPSVLGGKVALEKNDPTGKEIFAEAPIKENIEFMIKRIKAWRNLQTKPNRDKKIAIIYWNHTPGKQNVGASGLNVFRSVQDILKRMRKEGYFIENDLPSEEEIKELVLKSGRNIGSWVPGELDELLKSNQVVRWQVSDYLKFYSRTNEDFRKKVEEQWGKPDESKIMVKDNEFIIPSVPLGNVILMPQPARGLGDDPMKLYHDPTIWPHHQYIAFSLWLKNEFKADAIISLGKHGTQEWLPGKQTGLSQSCCPDVLILDIPNIYPYIMNNIGEGIQAKRRGRGVIIDHLVPSMKKADSYKKYQTLANLIDEYNDAIPRSKELADEKFKRIKILMKKLGLDKDLLLTEITEEAVEEVEHYLLELQDANIPYGLHTYGVSPESESLKEFSRLINEKNKDLPLNKIEEDLLLCGPEEIGHLIQALNGRYIPSGEGNGPLRNPDAIPTGKNFYGFDPDKVPSKDAFALGKDAAKRMIEKHIKEKGEYPDKIGLILWAGSIHRNEGSQVSTVLYLLGMKPIWDINDKVIGVEPIPGNILGRPRIDVHMQCSGLFRDSFPNVMILLDEAVRKAAQMKDVENFIAKHSLKIKTYLIEKGYGEEEAEELSHSRVFSEAPGSYYTKLQSLVPNSGLWESDEEIADVFIHHCSFAYGKKSWGIPLKSVYKKSLEDVDITAFSSGLLGNDDKFAYLGGLSLAVKRVSGEYPDVLISFQGDAENAHIEDIEKTIGAELRSRYLNPKWIEGMKKENYAGARSMSRFVEFLWGWQVVTPFAVDKARWEQVYEVYVEDKYDLDLKEFFNKNNPWAYQSISARMLEAIRKGYLDAPEEMKNKLAIEYAMSVIEKGVACCDHTCNNPALNQMVVNIISLPGMLSPELVNEFKTILSRALGMSIEEAAAKRKALQKELAQVTKEIQQEEKTPDAKISEKEGKENAVKGKKPEKDKIEGYEMVEEKKEDTKIVSSGAAMLVIIIVLCFMGLLVTGWIRKNR